MSENGRQYDEVISRFLDEKLELIKKEYTPEEFEIMLHKQSSFVRDAVANGIHIE